MKKTLLMIAIVAGFGTLGAHEIEKKWSGDEYAKMDVASSDSFRYTSIGVGPMPVPALNLGVGVRRGSGLGAIDIGCNVASAFFVHSARGYLNGIYYFSKNADARNYLGAGGSIGFAFGQSGMDTGFVAPNLIFGREFTSSSGRKAFLQMEALVPYLLGTNEMVPLPLITVKYGIGF